MRCRLWTARIGYGLLLLAALGLYLFENGGATRALLAVLAALPVLSALLLYLPRLQPEAKLNLPECLLRGENGEGRLTLQSNDPALFPLRLTLLVENELTGETQRLERSCRLKKREAVCELSLRSAHCGALRICLEDCRAVDALGLFSRRFPAAAEAECLVLPRKRMLDVSLGESADFLQDSQQYSAQKPGYDPSETFRIREYVPGDPIRQIHWKLSEKSEHLLVRDFGLPVVEQLLLLLETTAVEGGTLTAEDMDRLLELLSSVCSALTASELPFTLGWQCLGAFAERQIFSQEEADAALTEILHTAISSGSQSVVGACLAAHAVCTHAHAAVFSSYPAPDLQLLQHGGRVTLLIPRERAASLGVWEQDAVVLPFDEETAQLEL